jgi:hypothetical protein
MRFVSSTKAQSTRSWPGPLCWAAKMLAWVRRRWSFVAVSRADAAASRRPQAPLPDHDHSDNDPLAENPTLDGDEVNAAFPSVSAIIAALRNCTSGLKQTCKNAESDFLELGARLQTIHAEADQLTRKVIDVLSPDHNQTIQSALKIINKYAQNAMRELEQQQTELAGDIAGLKTIQDDLTALVRQNKNFKQIAKNLKMVRLNISIESARNEKAKMTFQALADEITGLAQKIHSVAGLIQNDADAAHQTIAAVQTEIGRRMRHLEQLLTSAETMVAGAMAEVDKLMDMSMTVLDGIGHKAGEIREQVSRLVVGIQMHDNISQRVTHIDSSIEESIGIMDTSCGIELPPPAVKTVLGRVYGINRLQSVHLKAIIDDVAEVGRQSESALDGLLTAVDAVAQPEGPHPSAPTEVRRFEASSPRHPVALLKKALDRLLALFDEGRCDIERLSTAREQTGRTVARVGEHIEKVRDINFEIHLKAINAVVQSSRLGHAGRAIEAIVNEIKELAEKSNATIRTVADIMQNIASASDRMDCKDRDEKQNADQAGRLLRQSIDDFSLACNVFKGQSQETFALGEALREKIAQSRSKVGFIEKMAADCDCSFAELMQVGELLQPYADVVSGEWLDEEKTILTRYTMERERDVHRQALQSTKRIDPKDRPSGGTVEVDSDAVLMEEFEANVELF